MLVDRGLAAVEEAECFRLLGQRTLGRVGMCLNGELVILPVNYRLVDGTLLFRAVEGSALSSAADLESVVFEADWFDNFSHQGWSVMVRGRAFALPADAEQGTGLIRTWAPGRRHHLVMITVDSISGRRIQKYVVLDGWERGEGRHGPPAPATRRSPDLR